LHQAYGIAPPAARRYPAAIGRKGEKMRTTIGEALKTAMKAQDKARVATLRMVQAAIKDRDIVNRGVGKGEAGNDEIAQLLAKMVKQREDSAKAFDDGNRPDLAAQERAEIEIIRDFMPKQLGDDEIGQAVREAIAATGASGPKDMGKVMAALREKFAGQMDFGKASGIVKQLLQ
jgi:uncharacterized protein YqeY